MRFSIATAILCLLVNPLFGAISSSIVWEVRTTGAQTNGGGFKTGATGTDYSQQAAAQYALNPVISIGASAVMVNVNAAAVMVGNICRVVSGTNAIVGWYEIISVNVGVDITVDRNWCTGICNDGIVNVGGALLLGGTLDDDFLEGMVAGNTIYVATGTYTIGENMSQAVNGTAVLPLKWIGYTAARDDATIGTDRPLFAYAAYTSNFGSFSIFKNLRFTMTTTTGFSPGSYSLALNCKVQNTGVATRPAFSLAASSRLISCEAISTNGNGIASAQNNQIVGCYAHDSATGILLQSNGNTIIDSVIDTCTLGISCQTFYSHLFVNNTIYNCTTGLSASTASVCIFLNNIITTCTTGASWTTATPSNFWDYNCWNNTTDVSNVTKGANDITADPLLTDAVNGDFTLQSGSPCLDTGMQIGANEGVTGDYMQNIGVDQDDNAAAPAGGGAAVYMGNF